MDKTSHYPAPSAVKFIAMSLCTFSVYQVYWSYKNWQFVRDRDGSDIRPFWRASFYPLWHSSLLSELGASLNSKTLSSRSRRAFLGISLIMLSSAASLPDPYWLLTFFSFLPFLPAVLPMARPLSSAITEQPRSTHRPANFVAYLLGGPLLVFVSLSSIGYIPSNVVVDGDYLWDRDIAYLVDAKILGPEEKIVYFFSGGLWSIKEDGQFISDKHVTSYWLDPDTGETHISFATYEEIENIKVVWAETIFDLTVITVTAADEGVFKLWISPESGGDKKFVDAMKRYWKLSNLDSRTDASAK